MSGRSVLIVTPYFAPQTHAAVFRAHKLAKYLPAHGWKPYVLTVDTNYLYNEDPGLLADLPEEIEIVRARYIEPTLRGVKMALGGADQSYVAHKVKQQDGAPSSSQAPRPSRWRREGRNAYLRLLNEWVYSPDVHWTWYRSALAAGRELVQQHGIDVVYSTAVPLTSHRIAAQLQRLGPKWVADFRDPVTYAAKVSSTSGRIRNRQYDIMRHTLRNADAVTGLASTYGPIFHDIYGDITKRPVRFIPTGVDDALIPAASVVETEDPYLIYAGEIMPEQTGEFFAMLARALGQASAPHRLLVVGHEKLNRERLGPIVREHGLRERVSFIDHLPQRELYRLIQGAKAGILVPGRTAYWWTNYAKLVDYVGLRKPVLAVVPDPSEARSVLTRSGLGVFLDADEAAATETLIRFLDSKVTLREPCAAECDAYLASAQVSSFVEVFEELLR